MLAKLYHILVKKAIFGLFLALFLFFTFELAQAKVPNDPMIQKDLWSQLNVFSAWDYSIGSKEVVVAIIDVGIDTDHTELKDNLWKNIYEIPDNGLDDDHNGYIDDINGWNFIENNNDIKPKVINKNKDTDRRSDPIHHGTLIAGLIGGAGDNGEYGVGLNWDIKIMGLRTMDNDGSGYTLTVAEAVDYAVNNGAQVINLSFVGDDNDTTLKQSLRRAYDKGVVIVSAAGNSGIAGKGDLDMYPQYPVCYDKNDGENWIIGVTSVDKADIVSVFADYGSCIDIVSLGEDIASTMIYSPNFGYYEKFGGGWRGNSFAAPTVAGTVALIKALRPDWTAQDIINTVLYTADNISANNLFYRGLIGSGRLNAGKALSTAFSSEISKIRPVKEIHYLSAKGLSVYNISSKRTAVIANIDTSQVKNLSVGSLFGVGDRETAMIIKYGSVYYARVFKTDGALWKEVPISLNAKGFIPTAVRLFGDGKNISLLVNWYDTKKNITKFVKYDLLESIPAPQEFYNLSGRAEAWTVGKNGHLFLSRIKNKTLLVEEVDLDGKLIYSWAGLKDAVGVEVLETGNVYGGDREQAVLLINRGLKKNTWQMTLDLPSKSFVLFDLKIARNTEPWNLFLGDFDKDGKDDIWRYKLTGGDFPVYSLSNMMLDTISVPVLKRPIK